MSDTTMPHPNTLPADHPLLAAQPEDDDAAELVGDELPDEDEGDTL